MSDGFGLYPPGAMHDSNAPWNRIDPDEEFYEEAIERLEMSADHVDDDFLAFVADNHCDLFDWDINKDTFNELENETKAHIRSEYIAECIDKKIAELAEEYFNN